VYKTNNSEQIVGQDCKATQDALITARISYKPNENNRNTIKTQSKCNTKTYLNLITAYSNKNTHITTPV